MVLLILTSAVLSLAYITVVVTAVFILDICICTILQLASPAMQNNSDIF